MRILVAGGTGVVGQRVVSRLLAAGHDVWATTTSTSRARVLEKAGARSVVADGLVKGQLRETVELSRPEVIVNQMTALAKPDDDYAAWLRKTNLLRSTAGVELAAGAAEFGVRRLVAQSASFMTAPVHGVRARAQADGVMRKPDRRLGLVLDETAVLYEDAPEPLLGHVNANLALERAVTDTVGVEGVVLRYGFLYGPGTAYSPDAPLVAQLRAGTFPIVGNGAGHYPFVHVDDAADAAVAMVTAGPPGVYNVVDDDPALAREWIPLLAALVGGPAPPRLSREEARSTLGAQSVYYGDELPAASNEKLKSTGFVFSHPTWKVGFRRVFEPSHSR